MIAQSTANSIFRSSSFTYTTQNGIYKYIGSNHRKVASNPCGIKYGLKGLKISSSEIIYYGYKDDRRTELIHCLCPTDVYKLNQCQNEQQSTLRRQISMGK